jgi:hypothetical protein
MKVVSLSALRILDVFPAVVSWKHIHLGIYMETGGCDCSLKGILMMDIIMPETC